MKPEQIVHEHRSFLEGAFDHIDGDTPDGAWFAMHVDTIEYLQGELLLPDGNAHDIFLAYLAAQEREHG